MFVFSYLDTVAVCRLSYAASMIESNGTSLFCYSTVKEIIMENHVTFN